MNIISIIVPIYHGRKYCKKIIQMIEENYSNLHRKCELELIFVNDSPSVELGIDTTIYKEIKIYIINNSKNVGIHQSRINGLCNASGNYILFLDQDDTISSNYFYSQLNSLSTSDAVLANGKNGSKVIYFDEDEQKLAINFSEFLRGYNRIVSPGQVLIKKDAIPQLWKNEVLHANGADDYFLWILMMLEKKKISINTEVVFVHNLTGENQSNNNEEMLNSIGEMIDKLKSSKTVDDNFFIDIEKRFAPNQDKLANYEKNQKNVYILDMWLNAIEDGKSIKKYFEENSIFKIAIYGLGILGKHLKREIKNSNITIKYIIDKNICTNNTNIPIIKPGDNMENIDAIIITPVWDYNSIYQELNALYLFKIISLEEIIFNLDCSLK